MTSPPVTKWLPAQAWSVPRPLSVIVLPKSLAVTMMTLFHRPSVLISAIREVSAVLTFSRCSSVISPELCASKDPSSM